MSQKDSWLREGMLPNLEGLIISSEADTWNVLEPNGKPSKTYLKEKE